MYLEDHLEVDAGYAAAAQALTSAFGQQHLRRRRDWLPGPLPLDLSRADVLAAGKQVLVMSSCHGGAGWNGLVYDDAERAPQRGRPERVRRQGAATRSRPRRPGQGAAVRPLPGARVRGQHRPECAPTPRGRRRAVSPLGGPSRDAFLLRRGHHRLRPAAAGRRPVGRAPCGPGPTVSRRRGPVRRPRVDGWPLEQRSVRTAQGASPAPEPQGLDRRARARARRGPSRSRGTAGRPCSSPRRWRGPASPRWSWRCA